MIAKSFGYFSLLLVLFVRCSDSSPVPPTCQLTKDTFTGSISYERNFTYGGGLLKSMTYSSTTVPSTNYVSTFYYGGDSRLDSILSSVAGSATSISVYTYDTNGRLSSIASNSGDTTNFEYNSHGQLIRRLFDRYPTDYVVEYIYPNTSTGNYSETVQTNSGGIQITSTYTYDDNSNPLYNLAVWADDYFTYTPNNIVQIESNISGSIQTTLYTYTYDEKGYPLTRTQASTGNVATFSVTCN
jgi:YD repeat-containing protein